MNFSAQSPLHSSAADGPRSTQDAAVTHDFDFLAGTWKVHHQRLKGRLVNSHEWEMFEGTVVARLLWNGQAIFDDNVLNTPEGTYRAVSMRTFDPKNETWAIWWFDDREPNHLDPPAMGKFRDSIGAFYADDVLRGKPIRVRFLWSRITATSARWEQAFSGNNGANWETNWIMEFQRSGPQ